MSGTATDEAVVDQRAAHHAERAERMVASLKKQQDTVYRQENLSKFFGNDKNTLNIAKNYWEQMQHQIEGAIQEQYHKVLEDFHVIEKLSQLDALESTHQDSDPAWRPSGVPEKDFNQAAGAVIRTTAIPEFEKMNEEVQGVTRRLEELLKEKQQELSALEAQIISKMDQLSTETADLT